MSLRQSSGPFVEIWIGDYFLAEGRLDSFAGGCTIGGHKKLGQTSNLYKVKNHKYTSCKFDFLEIRL
jgi:hypothetical protein